MATDSTRVRIFYVEDGARVAYTGTITERDPQQGFKVWFDNLRGSEQEWVTREDEWEWLPDEEPTDEPFVAVRLHMAGAFENSTAKIIRLPRSAADLAAEAAAAAKPAAKAPAPAAKKGGRAAFVPAARESTGRAASKGVAAAAAAAAMPTSERAMRSVGEAVVD